MAVPCILLSAICLCDYRQARIPNGLVLSLFFYGMGYRYWDAGGNGLRSFLESSLIVLLMMYPLFKIGTIGAGDVKLYAAVAGCLSGRIIIRFLFYSLLIAASISILKLIREKSGRERMGYFCAYLADVCRSGQWKLYLEDCADRKRAGICLSGPIFLSFLLHMGGVY